jgi:hypothetical protein
LYPHDLARAARQRIGVTDGQTVDAAELERLFHDEPHAATAHVQRPALDQRAALTKRDALRILVTSAADTPALAVYLALYTG